MADALRGSMDAAEYTHVVLGLTFKYISDAFEPQARRGAVGPDLRSSVSPSPITALPNLIKDSSV